MEIDPTDVALRLGELIAALDRRAPRVDGAAEAAIARDAAVLRTQAVNRLAEVTNQTPNPPDPAPRRGR